MPAHKSKDRIFETSITMGVGAYALDGAQTGFQSFSAWLTGNYGFYFATDDVNWEVGIGTWTSGPSTLARTHILASSNGGAAVNWGAGTKKIHNGLPAAYGAPRIVTKSVAGGAGDVALSAEEQLCDVLILTGALTGNRTVTVHDNAWRWVMLNATSGAYTLSVKTAAGASVALVQGKSKVLFCDGADVKDGHTDYPIAASLDGARGLKAVPFDPGQGTWVNGTTTYSAQASGFYGLTTTTNNDGHIVGDTAQFGAVGYTVSQIATGSPVYEYTYWNGSAWTALSGVSAPTFTALGRTQLRFTVPGDWAVGGSGTGVPAGNYNIRVRATTAPSQAVQGRADLLNKVTITADEVVASESTGGKYRKATLSIAPDVRVAGSAANGRDQAGAFGAGSWIYKWAIYNPTTDTWAGLWSASATAPTLPAGYTAKVLLGADRFDANSVLVPANQRGKELELLVGTLDLNAGSATVATSFNVTVPPEATKVRGRMDFTGSITPMIFFHDQPFTVSGSNGSTTDIQMAFPNFFGSTEAVGAAELRISLAQTLYYAIGNASGAISWRTRGWTFPGNLN